MKKEHGKLIIIEGEYYELNERIIRIITRSLENTYPDKTFHVINNYESFICSTAEEIESILEYADGISIETKTLLQLAFWSEKINVIKERLSEGINVILDSGLTDIMVHYGKEIDAKRLETVVGAMDLYLKPDLEFIVVSSLKPEGTQGTEEFNDSFEIFADYAESGKQLNDVEYHKMSTFADDVSKTADQMLNFIRASFERDKMISDFGSTLFGGSNDREKKKEENI